jgi:hypothetical protein
VGPFAAVVLTSFVSMNLLAPAPFPRERRDAEVKGNEANVKKIRDAIRDRRSTRATIVLAVGEEWLMPKLLPPGGKPRRCSVMMDGGTGDLANRGTKDGVTWHGKQEGTSSLTYTFDQDEEDRARPYEIVIVFVFKKATSD